MKHQTQTVPRLSPNDAELKVVCWLVEEGSYVKKGKDLFSAESSKSVSDVQAEFEGYVYFLVNPEEWVEIGKPVVLFAAQKDGHVKDDFLKSTRTGAVDNPGEKKFTRKAELIARQHRVALEDIQKDGTIREEDVLNYVNSRMSNKRYEVHEKLVKGVDYHLKKRVIVIGAGVGAVQIVDVILRSRQQEIVGLLDDNSVLHGRTVLGQKILGPIEMAHQLWKAGSFDGAVISFSKDLGVRMKFFQELVARGIPFTNVIDPSAQINSNVSLGVGNVVLAGVVLGACAHIGNNNFISAYVNIEHHSIVGDCCSFGPGVMTSGEVKIGAQVKFGTGIFIEPQISIGSRSTISSGVAVTSDIPEDTVVKKDFDYKLVQRMGH